MKILRIRLKNINSLKGEWEIRLDEPPLARAGIFAITGQTGSGKTTILDAITLALYGKTPRFTDNKGVTDTVIQESGAIMTHHTNEAYAEVDFECPRGRFTARWSVATKRTGRLATPQIELADETGRLLSDKKTEALAAIEARIGLSYDQFVRAALLAQGEFARFLQAPKKLRNELLEKLTGTSIYRLIGQKTFEVSKQHRLEVDDLNKRKTHLEEGLLPDPELAAKEKAYHDINRRQQQARTEHQKYSRLLQDLQEFHQRQKALVNLQQQLHTLQKEQDLFHDTDGKRLEAHERLDKVLKDLRRYLQLDDELAKLNRRLEDNRRETREVQQQLQQLHKLAQDLSPAPIKDFAKDLRALEKKVVQKEEQLDRLGQQFDALVDKAIPLLEELDLPTERKLILKKTRKAAESLSRQLNTSKKALQKRLPETARRQPAARLKKLRDQRQRLTGSIALYERRIQLRRQLDDIEKAVQKAQADLKELSAQIAPAEALQKQLAAELKELRARQEIHLLKKQLADHRHKLREGEPCPLCGATSHPYGSQKPDTASDEFDKALEAKQMEADKSLQRVTALRSKHQETTGRLNEYKKREKSLRSELRDLQQQWEKNMKSLPDLPDADPRRALEKLQTEEDDLQAWIETDHQLHQLSRLQKLWPEMERLVTDGESIRKEKEKLYRGKDIRREVAELLEQYHKLDTQLRQLAKAEQSLTKELGVVQKEMKNIDAAVHKRIGERAKSAARHILDDDELKRLTDRRHDLRIQKEKLLTEVKTHQTEIQKLQARTADLSLEKLTQTIDQLNAKLDRFKAEGERLFAIISSQQKLRKQIEHIHKEIKRKQKANRKWILLNDAIGDATGNKFNDFAQELTLRHLVSLANKRLEHIIDRYRLDIPEPDEDDLLTLIDLDMAGRRRSVKTLSGGEQFMVSLALALALSDLTSGKTEIKTLFIDEGFGALDEESLEQVISTLERLQAETEKVIGIISHVPTLKERFTNQIHLIKHGSGYSSLKVL